MKQLRPTTDKSFTLTAGQLDLRSPSGQTTDGRFRLIVNAIGDTRGQLRRLGGFRRLSRFPNAADQKFAIVADFGFADANQMAVASMIGGWSPSYVVTAGDNIYGLNPGMTLQQANDRFSAVINSGYQSFYSSGTLYPTIGNHDTDYDPANPTWFRSKFPSLFQGGTKNYYKIAPGDGSVEFFILSSGYNTAMQMFEPDGNTSGSAQWNWLKANLSSSAARWKIVVLHHSPYTSDVSYGPGTVPVRWDFAGLGADAVISGHSHNYERWIDKAVPYIVTGNGGATLRGYTKGASDSHSIIDVPPRFGALRCTVTHHELLIEEVVVGGTVYDSIVISKGCNDDLHDQLLYPFRSANVSVSMPAIMVSGGIATGGAPTDVQASMSSVSISVPVVTAYADNVVEVPLPTVTVFAPTVTATTL